MSISSRQRPSSVPSTTSLQPTVSLRSTGRHPPPPISTVVTTPPWARDEPPSPKDQTTPLIDTNQASESRPSDVASYYSSNPTDHASHWWTFTLPRPARQHPRSDSPTPSTPKHERKGLRDLSISSWLPTSSTIREGTSFSRKEKEVDSETARPSGTTDRDHGLSIALPTPPAAPYTLSHNTTPGWDSPWTPAPAAQGPSHQHDRNSSYGLIQVEGESNESHKPTSMWRQRKHRLRSFILYDAYVPLLFRFINITFTSAALGVAVHIRGMEISGHVMGAVGSSPTVVIIFAPLTLVHVMVAVYLEYFGRPLGLWRTSGKLTHTLSEVLFICAWSAALSLCFDNFFTSLIPCASPDAISWYNQLPRPANIAPNFEGGLGDRICDYQLALICLVGIGLMAYCANLIISLFRIFEKVKYRPAATPAMDSLLGNSPQTASAARATSRPPARSLRGLVEMLSNLQRDYVLGIILLLIVVLLWSASNFVTQELFFGGFQKPFLVTYLNTSSFALYLLPFVAKKRWRQQAWSLGGRLGYEQLDTEPHPVHHPQGEEEMLAIGATRSLPPLSARETIDLAFVFCFLWFIANWSLNAALNYTSVASATILSSTSGLFTLAIGRLFLVETLTVAKILAVFMSFGGVLLVSLSDASSPSDPRQPVSRAPAQRPLMGDILAIISALVYALYVILLKVRIRTESRIDMRLFFGFVGLFNILTCWAIGVVLHLSGIELLELPTTRAAINAILINMLFTLTSDYLYVIAMLKTTPLVVTIGLSLTIPISVVGDFILGKTTRGLVLVGALLVIVSFVVVGLDDAKTRSVKCDDPLAADDALDRPD
ncbi:putative saccharomyces cerevisiae YDL133W [Lyophyllum shimeji]|uniref:Saccharomyces cerevisiae YDL133W n=1 Tax=Lyophyllum shimeji TaxID=47721 RepID=A0A9P3PHW6_LYOSH|nr:putative saccharomyces cerevisiae YDL133W [Lyophyllum shimeji]